MKFNGILITGSSELALQGQGLAASRSDGGADFLSASGKGLTGEESWGLSPLLCKPGSGSLRFPLPTPWRSQAPDWLVPPRTVDLVFRSHPGGSTGHLLEAGI